MSSKVHFLRGFLLALWLFANTGVKCELETVFEKCCAIGRNKSTESLKCDAKIQKPIPGIAIEQHSVCFSTIDLCCTQSLRDIACENGKKAARQNKNCNVQSKSDDETTYKHCCEACKLGLISASMVGGCKPKNFHFGHPWDSSYESCCFESEHQTLTGTEPSDLCQLLPGELCTQLCISTGGSYKCGCRAGYVLMADGKTCKEDITENRCEKYNCDHNCYDNGETLECSCNPGYELLADNKTCIDINECNLKLDNCSEYGQTCENTKGSFQCVGKLTNRSSNGPTSRFAEISTRASNVCARGYRYDASKNTCVDVDECKEQNSCDKTKERCINTAGSYRCEPLPTVASPSVCGAGFAYSFQHNGCVDIDECQEQRCDSNEICLNRVGSFTCECKIGFQRDPLTHACVDVNECQLRKHNCPQTSRCDNTVGSYQCTRAEGCGTGYTLNVETGECEDDDECALGIDNCKLLGGPDWECRNIVGSFRCVKKRCDESNPNCAKTATNIHCAKGYALVNGECADIDECARGQHTCRSTETCVNIAGGFKCVLTAPCGPGLRYNNQQTYCVDIDECTEQPSVCDHGCLNIWASFLCTCNPGYRLHSDNRSCVDINECEVYKDRTLCIGYCVNTPGSYKCQCPDGYRLGKFGTICEDIDECASTTTCNQPNDVCVNMRGSYRCNKITCPANYVQDPNQKNRCVRVHDFCMLNRNCTYWPMSYTFAFFALSSNFPISTAGHEFYRLKGPSSPAMSSQFSLELKNVQAADRVNKTTSDYFKLNYRSSNEVILAMVRSIRGPQDIELDLKTQFYYNGVHAGHAISKLFIYVSQYDF